MKSPDAIMLAFLKGDGSTLRTIGTRKAREWMGREDRTCTWCGDPVPKARFTWCGDATCLAQWDELTDTRLQRQMVSRRDNGICALCGFDTQRLERILTKLYTRLRRKYTPQTARRYSTAIAALRSAWGVSWTVGANPLWEADHIVPVCEGGGLCTIDNLRTVCIPCHKAQTKALRARLRLSKKAA